MSLWKYTAWDAILVLITLTELGLKIGWAFYAAEAGLAANCLVVLLLILLYFYNFIVVNHEFMHTPFFNAEKLNAIYLVLSSANLMYPMSIIKEGHNFHHIHNNDPLRNGTTQDPTSTWLYGKDGKQEHFVRYALCGFFRQNTPSELKKILPGLRDKSYGKYLYWEIAAAALVCLTIISINWLWFVLGVLPTIYFGWVLTDNQNYFEHHRATNPESRYADSVSYYGKLYNLLWFNEGYHQEHHLKPNCHWKDRPALRTEAEKAFKAQGAYQASLPAMFGFLDKGKNQR
ncbi:MAG: fatty acid desaturase [Pseudomonadales bacterium]|nr:fatty acid desaturase [Pseudomonadales bacterium]